MNSVRKEERAKVLRLVAERGYLQKLLSGGLTAEDYLDLEPVLCEAAPFAFVRPKLGARLEDVVCLRYKEFLKAIASLVWAKLHPDVSGAILVSRELSPPEESDLIFYQLLKKYVLGRTIYA